MSHVNDSFRDSKAQMGIADDDGDAPGARKTGPLSYSTPRGRSGSASTTPSPRTSNPGPLPGPIEQEKR